MRLEIILDGGIARTSPLILEAAQVVIRNEVGTLVGVAAEFGEGLTVSHALDENFHETLRQLGIRDVTICEVIELPRPAPGARLIAGPRGAKARARRQQ